jgi:hypothetical protein
MKVLLKALLLSFACLGASLGVYGQTVVTFEDGTKYELKDDESLVVLKELVTGSTEGQASVYDYCAQGLPTGALTFDLIDQQRAYRKQCDEETLLPWCDVVDNQEPCSVK